MKTHYLDYARDDESNSWRYKSTGVSYTEVQKIRNETFSVSNIDTIEQWGFNSDDREYNLKNTDFYQEKKDWFKISPHAFFSWKPYIILNKLERINDNDILVYWDCNPIYREFTGDWTPFLKNIYENLDMIAGLEVFGLLHRNWTKRDCFELMGCTDRKYIINRKQIQASWSVWKKTPKTIKVVTDWLKWCKNENVIRHDIDSICGKPEYIPSGGYFRHARDQSVLTNIAVTHNCNVISSRHSGLRLNSYFGKNLDKIANNYTRCAIKTL